MTSMPLTVSRVFWLMDLTFDSFKRGAPRLNEGPPGAPDRHDISSGNRQAGGG
jgi:hypothetical protein